MRPLRRLYRAFFGDVQGYFEAESVREILRKYLLLPDRSAPIPLNTPLLWAVTDLANGCGDYYFQARQSAGPFATALVGTSLAAALRPYGVRLRPAPSDSETFIEALRASSAIPGVFEPALVEDRFLVDGGVINNTPFNLAKLAANALFPNRQIEIHAVLLDTGDRRTTKDERRNVKEILLSCYGVMSQRILDDAARLVVTEGQLARTALAQRGAVSSFEVFATDEALRLAASVTLKYVRPSRPLAGSGFDFTDKDSIKLNYELGAADIGSGFHPYELPLDFCKLGPRD